MRLVLLLAICTIAAQAHDVITTKITWTREVSRIVYKSCASCHREGGSAFSLLTYEEARPWAKAIKEEVLARRMPVWNAVKGFGEFKNDQGLTQEQIEIIANWVEGGAPEGNPAYLPDRPVFPAKARVSATAKVPVNGLLTLAAATTITGIQPVTIGTVQVIATRPDGRVDPLLWVQAFSPANKQQYWFKSPLHFPAGTKIEITPKTASALLLK
jgi:mono/diheme cytochrome c family protein